MLFRSELDWHSFPLMTLAVISTMFTCVRLMALVQRWRGVLLASYLVVIGCLVVPVLAQGGASYSNIFRASGQVPAVVDAGALRAVSGSIPRDARLCVSSDLMPFFGNRRSMLHPNWVNEANYILINRRRREDDAANAEAFLRTAPGSDAATAHFKAEIADVLRGYPYDTALFDAVDRLIVEHKISHVKDFVQRLMVMHEGRVIAEGGYEECLNHPEVRKSYWQIDDSATEEAT